MHTDSAITTTKRKGDRSDNDKDIRRREFKQFEQFQFQFQVEYKN